MDGKLSRIDSSSSSHSLILTSGSYSTQFHFPQVSVTGSAFGLLPVHSQVILQLRLHAGHPCCFWASSRQLYRDLRFLQGDLDWGILRQTHHVAEPSQATLGYGLTPWGLFSQVLKRLIGDFPWPLYVDCMA